MAKFSYKNKLPLKEEQKLLLELCQALTIVKKIEDAGKLLADLLSPQELAMIAKRLKIAKLLLKEKKYSEIKKHCKVSDPTIARVNSWLQESGEGYKLIATKAKEIEVPDYWELKKTTYKPGSWKAFQRKYPAYYWPQILIDEIIDTASKRQKEKLLRTIKILKKSGKKYKIFKEIEEMLSRYGHETKL